MPSQATMNEVLELLQRKDYLPSELLRALLERGRTESDVKEAVAQLLHAQELELTPTRYLHAVAAAAV